MAQTKLKGKQVETFTDTTEGVVPASGGGTTNFLRADGTWATPAGGGGGGSLETDLVTLNTTQTITGNKQFDNVRLINKVLTGTYPTTSGGSYRIGGTGGYDVFDFYSIDGNESDGFGVSQIYSNPEEGNQIYHKSLDNQQSSILNVNYVDTYLRHIFGGQKTSLYIDGITDKIIIEGTQNRYAALGTSLIANTRNFEFPDKNGTLALLSDIIESAENKVDKVSTTGVERAYIVNADGSQGTKATSEIGGGLSFQEVLRVKTILNNI